MEVSPPAEEAPNRWYRVAAWTAGSALILSALAAAFWPQLLEGMARKKATAVLERKFDVVEFGCFELSRSSLHICDVHLEKESVTVDLEDVFVEFEPRWLERRVIASHISSRGGLVAGNADDIRELKGSSSSSPGRAGSSNLVLEDAELVLEELELDIHHGSLELKTTASASSSGTAGPVALELTELELLKEDQLVAGASTVKTELQLEALFPLELEIVDALAQHDEVVIKDVAGQVRLEDEALEQVFVDLHGQTESGQSWTLQGSLDRAEGVVDVALAALDIRPSQLPGAHQLPLQPEEGHVTVDIHIKGSRKKVRLEGKLALEDVHVVHPKLAKDAVVLDNSFEGAAVIDLEKRELVLEHASISALERPGWQLEVAGRVLFASDPDQRELELKVSLESAPCQELLEAVPPGLAPALEGFELAGNTSIDLEMVAKMSDPEATVFQGGIDVDSCKLEKVPQAVADMTGPFSHVVRMKTGRTVTRLLGRGALYYTPYDRMPAHLPAAVMATEDGGFWRHDGFIKSQFEASLKRNVELGKFRRGASTITMQMVKNVLLTQEKTVSRKLQELFLTWVIEEKLGKQRIMEVYLNVVEFGPGIYGVGDAADHYFGKTPYELTSFESAFLATLLPRPIERHEMWCRGELTEKHAKYVHRVHLRMLASHRITRAEFDAAEAAEFVFSRRGWAGEAACLAEGRRVAEGTHTQGAISGLLLGRPE